MFKDFKDFAARGNVIDLAVGVILGASFGKIVSSFVTDILMPPIGLLLGRMDFSNLYVNLSGGTYASLAEAKKAGAATINYGLFANQVIDFLIVTFSVFLMVKGIQRLRRKEEPQAATTKVCPYCLSSIPLGATKCAHCTSELKAS